MTLSEKIFLSILFISVVVFLATLPFVYPSKPLEPSPQKPCPPTTFVKVNGHIFEVPRQKIDTQGAKPKVPDRGCSSSLEDPVEAASISIREYFKLKNFDDPILIQFIVESPPDESSRLLAKLKMRMSQEGLRIEDLPKVGNFYKYSIYGHDAGNFIGARKKLLEPDGITPLVVAICSAPKTTLACATSFNWKNKLHVRVRPWGFTGRSAPIDVWEDIYALSLDYLEEIYRPNKTESEK